MIIPASCITYCALTPSYMLYLCSKINGSGRMRTIRILHAVASTWNYTGLPPSQQTTDLLYSLYKWHHHAARALVRFIFNQYAVWMRHGLKGSRSCSSRCFCNFTELTIFSFTHMSHTYQCLIFETRILWCNICVLCCFYYFTVCYH